jgi:hypothetical protein
VITAGGAEGIRRAVFLVQDLMRAAGGPFLPRGAQHRTPQVTTRISRCFFGPINRPPANRDELTDDVDYYPPQYLNRLAHEGVNGIWITVRLRELYAQDWSGVPDIDPAVRLAKLQRTIDVCARYGIRVFLFCIDPAAFGEGAEYLIPSRALERHPEFAGHRDADWTNFCTRSAEGRAYTVAALRHDHDHDRGASDPLLVVAVERRARQLSPLHAGRAGRGVRRTPADAPRRGECGIARCRADQLDVRARRG